MNIKATFTAVVVVALAGLSAIAATNSIPNRLIDYAAFQGQVMAVGKWRESHRVTEAQFIEMAGEPGTVILDARSHEKFQMLHVKGAKNLCLPDFTAAELAKVIPTKKTRVLIYCNNNFLNAPRSMPTKSVAASLNLYTFNNLVSYGYTNVYELGPLVNVHAAQLPLEGSDVEK